MIYKYLLILWLYFSAEYKKQCFSSFCKHCIAGKYDKTSKSKYIMHVHIKQSHVPGIRAYYYFFKTKVSLTKHLSKIPFRNETSLVMITISTKRQQIILTLFILCKLATTVSRIPFSLISYCGPWFVGTFAVTYAMIRAAYFQQNTPFGRKAEDDPLLQYSTAAIRLLCAVCCT